MKHEMQKPRSGCLALVLAALLGLCVFMTLAGITAPLLLSDMLFQKGSQMWKVAAVVVPMLCLFISIAVGCGAIRMMKRKSLFMLFFTVAWCGCISPEQNEFARYAPLDVCGIIGLSKGLIAHNRPDVDLNDLRLFCVQREYRDIATTFKHSRPIAEETLVVLFFLESSRREERATEHPDPFTIPSSNSDGTWNVSYTGVMITIDPWGNVSNSTVQILEDVSAGSYPKEKAAPIL